MKPILPIVTDHAVLRYLERAEGVPVEDVRRMLQRFAAIGALHETPIVPLGRVKLVTENGIVITVLRRNWSAREERATS